MIQRLVCSCQKTFGSRKSGKSISRTGLPVVCPCPPTIIAVGYSLIFHPLTGAALLAMPRVDGDQGGRSVPNPLESAKSTSAEPE